MTWRNKLSLQHYIVHWVLALMLVISPLQLTMAGDFDRDSHHSNCATHTAHTSDSDSLSVQCAMEHNEHCQDHPGCMAHFQSTSLVSLSSSLLSRINVILTRLALDEEHVLTLYPSLPERPPKA